MIPDIRFTSSARRQLLEAVVALREIDRARAVALIDAVEEKLEAVADSAEPIREVRLSSTKRCAESDFRLIYRIRDEVVWVVAVFEPDGSWYSGT